MDIKATLETDETVREAGSRGSSFSSTILQTADSLGFDEYMKTDLIAYALNKLQKAYRQEGYYCDGRKVRLSPEAEKKLTAYVVELLKEEPAP